MNVYHIEVENEKICDEDNEFFAGLSRNAQPRKKNRF